MARYFVETNKRAGGEHVVHRLDCAELPGAGYRLYLGDFPSCHSAMIAARMVYPAADGCAVCAAACHRR